VIHEHVELYNVHELLSTTDAQGLTFCRIPNDLRLQLNEAAMRNALQATGCEMRFNLLGDGDGAPGVRIVLQSTESPSIVEIYQGPFLVGWHVVGLEPTEIIIRHPEHQPMLDSLHQQHNLPFDPRLTRVLLPWRPPALLLAIEGEMAPPRPEQTPSYRMLTYGSSITHGNSAIRPSGTWASRTAQRLGVDLLNLGFGGGAHLEPQMADYIAGRDDWHLATLELGINLIGQIDADEFARRVAYFIPTIARAHPHTWIFCIDLFTCRYDWEDRSKIAAFRRIVAEQVAELGLPKLVHLSGAHLLPSLSGLTADLVHPSPYGMEEIAQNLATIIAPKLAQPA
jgi:lysophospholipase L1-like esterase